MELSIKQRELLGQFFGNLAVAWIAGGFIGPFVTNWNIENLPFVTGTSIVASVILVRSMLLLVREDKI